MWFEWFLGGVLEPIWIPYSRKINFEPRIVSLYLFLLIHGRWVNYKRKMIQLIGGFTFDPYFNLHLAADGNSDPKTWLYPRKMLRKLRRCYSCSVQTKTTSFTWRIITSWVSLSWSVQAASQKLSLDSRLSLLHDEIICALVDLVYYGL